MREYVAGEIHYHQGHRYQLDVREEEAAPRVMLRNRQFMELRVRPGSTVAQRVRVLQEWYREWLKEELPAVVAKWKPMVGQQAAEWSIKLMKTKWSPSTLSPPHLAESGAGEIGTAFTHFWTEGLFQ